METEQARMDARCCWEAIRLLTVDVAVAHSDLCPFSPSRQRKRGGRARVWAWAGGGLAMVRACTWRWEGSGGRASASTTDELGRVGGLSWWQARSGGSTNASAAG
ncbi:hypothetical protein EJB05_15878 [Eragrostis curvula]|uniref:Uncharacterized protein n=1 Tax=Eragrostis curvula TaxID=38414 RepID=A0A5J9VDD3_9POAL|nr:hypothetical protein EJB05_15878 [Eragrostis curvula]